ncbi:hypothetical protein [uncultured Abyssibacter sp.]|uniref:hypothetical protein n=1 Tax=uncultured Abyssibacter sp. TaxID=2320202 RepID=UPI0032B1FAFE
MRPTPFRRLALPTLIAAGWLLGTPAQAEPAFARLYKNQFGYMPSCNACHKDGGGTPVNQYGQQFKDAGLNAGAFAKIAALDADGDGVRNGAESEARSSPGSDSSTPDAPGDWLDTSNLIPKAVRALFPDVTTYKLVDAIFTDREIARAAARGVTLAAEDENTIYVPVRERRPIGTAIIVPGQHEGQQFFVLLATDRQLRITHASAIDAGSLEAARREALYDGFIGQSVETLEPPDADDAVPAAVNRTVQKAATMLLVRLKSG